MNLSIYLKGIVNNLLPGEKLKYLVFKIELNRVVCKFKTLKSHVLFMILIDCYKSLKGFIKSKRNNVLERQFSLN